MNLEGFNVKQKRDFNPGTDETNRPVFVQGPFGDQSPFPVNYEYSGDAPARLSRTIDNLLYGPHNRQNFINLFYSLPEIFAPINEIASRVADAAWQLRRTGSKDDIITNDVDFNRLFSDPNPLMSHKQLVYQAVCYEILTGQCLQFASIPGSLPQTYQNVTTWSNIPTQSCTVNKKTGVDPYSATSIEDFVNYYESGNRRFEPKNVLSITNHDLISGNRIDGYVSQLLGAKLAIRNLLPVYEARGVIYIKRGALGFVVSRKQDDSGTISLTPKEKEETQNEFQNTYGLSANKNLVGVTSAPVDFIKTAMSIKELQPFDETQADALAIYACLRVPKHLCPTKEQSTYDNADADMKSFYGDTIIPLANKYADKWTTFFKIPNRYIYADFSTVAILQEDRKEKVSVDQINGNVYLQRFTSGICSLNDWIIANGDIAVIGNDLYEKKLFEMTPEQVIEVNKILNLKAQSSGTPAGKTSTEKPVIE